MASTTDQMNQLEDAIVECLDAGDSEAEVLEAVEQFIEAWRADNNG